MAAVAPARASSPPAASSPPGPPPATSPPSGTGVVPVPLPLAAQRACADASVELSGLSMARAALDRVDPRTATIGAARPVVIAALSWTIRVVDTSAKAVAAAAPSASGTAATQASAFSTASADYLGLLHAAATSAGSATTVPDLVAVFADPRFETYDRAVDLLATPNDALRDVLGADPTCSQFLLNVAKMGAAAFCRAATVQANVRAEGLRRWDALGPAATLGEARSVAQATLGADRSMTTRLRLAVEAVRVAAGLPLVQRDDVARQATAFTTAADAAVAGIASTLTAVGAATTVAEVRQALAEPGLVAHHRAVGLTAPEYIALADVLGGVPECRITAETQAQIAP